MLLSRPHLAVLLNALYDTGTTRVSVQHPSDTVGELCEFELGPPDESTVRIHADREAYAERRRTVAQEHGSPAVDELPEPQSYVNAYLAGGLLDVGNRDEVDEFLERNGSPDLTAGHPPVLAGFDTNLLPWRIADVLDLTPAQDGVINGFALATGVLDELDWDYKRSDTQPLEDAFGAEFERLWNQPAGDNREGRLGENYYRVLRDHRYAEEVVSETGDDAIVAAYDEFQDDRKDVLLFSNDRDFVERARAHRVLAQRVTFPESLPTTLTGSWRAMQDTLYVLAILFGVIKLPKATVYGVWRGKGGMDWQHERLEIDYRSPKLEPILDRDTAILEACEQ